MFTSGFNSIDHETSSYNSSENLFHFNVRQKTITQLSHGTNIYREIAWSKDGSKIVGVVLYFDEITHFANYDLFVLDVTNIDNPQDIRIDFANSDYNELCPTWIDDERIAFVSERDFFPESHIIYIANIVEGTIEQIPSRINNVSCPLQVATSQN